MALHWDIFCRVVDNYGDIGICWRLARQLVREHGQAVRLWVDDPSALAAICPACGPALPAQSVQGVELRRWPADFVADRVADLVIEAFACDLPAAYLALMASAARKPRWINLEYLSAEAWVEGCHGLSSPHPSLPLIKHFFFPGFTPATGGLLREAGLTPAPLPDPADTLEISLFCYDSAPVGGLLAALAESHRPILCHVPSGKPLAAVTAALGPADNRKAGWQLGQARIQPIPFLPLDDYDALLRRCAINFVRGEDSFVRAQWAGRPFVWQIYPQEDAAHQLKLDAFLERYCAALAPAAASAARALFAAWNAGNGAGKPADNCGNCGNCGGGGDIGAAWQDFLANLPEIARHNLDWARQLAGQPDLAANLINFAANAV